MEGNKAVYEVIKNRIIERLKSAKENGEVFRWVRGWEYDYTGNAYTGRRYKGINALFLDGKYITYKQLKEFAAKHPETKFVIPKGAKQETVYFYKFESIAEEIETDEGKVLQAKTIPLIRFYKVFHIDQIENLAPFFASDVYEHNLTAEMQKAEGIIKDFCGRTNLTFEVKTGGSKCCYSPKTHKVTVPKISQFKSAPEYYASVFHEMVHSTAVALGRDISGGFGSDSYSQEELVAEIGSQMIMSRLNMEIPEVFENSVAYIDGWLNAISSKDIYFVASACSKAQKACDLILNELFVANSSDEAA